MHTFLSPNYTVGLAHEGMDLIVSQPLLLGCWWLDHWQAVAGLWVCHWLPHWIFAQGPVHSPSWDCSVLSPNLTTPAISWRVHCRHNAQEFLLHSHFVTIFHLHLISTPSNLILSRTTPLHHVRHDESSFFVLMLTMRNTHDFLTIYTIDSTPSTHGIHALSMLSIHVLSVYIPSYSYQCTLASLRWIYSHLTRSLSNLARL